MKIRLIMLALFAVSFTACSYDEDMEVCNVSVELVFPNGSEPYAGARVELIDSKASIFVDSTDANGVAHFTVTPGIYEARSSNTHETYDYRYFFNGVKSLIVISPDSTNHIPLKLSMSKKRIIH